MLDVDSVTIRDCPKVGDLFFRYEPLIFGFR